MDAPVQLAPHPAAPAPAPPGTVRLCEVLGALSYALDLTEGQPEGHCQRAAWIGMHIGAQLGLDDTALCDLFYTLLLKDAGCSSNAARLWQLYGGDDRRTKHDYKTVDSQSLRQLARFVLTHAGPGERLRQRIERVLAMARHGDALANELIQTRCERGADIVRRLGFGDRVAQAVYALDEHWNGRGRAQGMRGVAIPLGARIALVAQVVDVFHEAAGPEAALQEAARRAGSWFDPRVVAALQAASLEPGFWSGLGEPGLDARVAALEPGAQAIMADEDRLDSIAEAFADVIDAKSSFTRGHSERVTLYADRIAENLGLSAPRRRWLRRAALLHDIGKLGVSNAILDKPGPLDAAERAAVQRHATLSGNILARSVIFRDLAPVAAAHHERPDGQGYPLGLEAEEIPLEARIITVADVFDALTATRPYRGAMPQHQALAVLERERGTGVDGACLDALRAGV